MAIDERDRICLEKITDLENAKRVLRNASTRIAWNSQSQSIENIGKLLNSGSRYPEIVELVEWGYQLGLYAVLALGVAFSVSRPDPEFDEILAQFHDEMRAGIDKEHLLAASAFLLAVARSSSDQCINLEVASIALNRVAYDMEWQSNIKSRIETVSESPDDHSAPSWEVIFLLVFGILWGCFLSIG